MPRVAVVMGSESDRQVMEQARPYFNFFGIEADYHVMSAHRTPQQVQEFSQNAREAGYEAVIAGAGMAAHLPGVIAAYTPLPVIGVPLAAGALNGLDALYAMVQMPAGVPVATMAIGSAGARNAAIFAAQILALKHPDISERLHAFKRNNCRIPE